MRTLDEPLREGYHIVKVRAKRPLSSAAISRHLDLSRENLAKISEFDCFALDTPSRV